MRRALASVLWTLVACGSDSPGIELADLAAAQLSARCSYLVRCGVFASQDACDTYARLVEDGDPAAAKAAGRLSYDEEAAARCVDLIATQACDTTDASAREQLACQQMFRGELEAVATCAFDEECKSGRCLSEACGEACCLGTCAAEPPGPVDAACAVDRDCQHGLFCSDTAACTPLSGVGAPCRRDDHCGYGSFCIGAGVGLGACREAPQVGDPCPYGRCADVGARCDNAQICVAAGHGTPCSDDTECTRFGECDPATNTCVDFPTLGMPCRTRCGGASWCNRSTPSPTCAAPLENGTPCGTGDQCASSFCEVGPAFDQCNPAPICI